MPLNRSLAAVVLFVWCSAMQQSMNAQSSIKTFTAPANTFSFMYPADFRVCTSSKMEDCRGEAFIPPCDEDSIVCVIYPKEKLSGTNFEGAGFQVRTVRYDPGHPNTPNECVTPRGEQPGNNPEFLISASTPTRRVGPVRFIHGVSGGVATGHYSFMDVYRYFHKKSCYEITWSVSALNRGVLEDPDSIREFNRAQVVRAFSAMLDSFRFK
jgi:hypothetical protein